MQEYLKKLPEEVRGLVRLASDLAVSKNVAAYLVGGCVRDMLLGAKNFDLDIVVEGDGIIFAETLGRALQAKVIRHRRFGTATVIVRPHLKIDFTTARKEFYPEPAHLPVVESGTLHDDLFRRDFTVNAMAISIVGSDFGELVDYFSGKSDLVHKRIRVMHKLSFIDDPTRILRAIRFEQRFDFKIDAQTLKYLKDALGLKMLEKVEPQRLRDDLILILKENHPIKELRRMQKLTGFDFIVPRLKISSLTMGLLRSVEKQIDWFRADIPQRRHLDAWLMYLIALLSSLQASKIEDFCRRFALRRGEETRILGYKAISGKLITKLCNEDLKPSDVYELLEPLSYEVILMLRAKYKNKTLQRHIRDFFTIYNGMRIHVCGEDLHKLGLAPGPSYQKIFRRVLHARLDGKVASKDDELELARKYIHAK